MRLASSLSPLFHNHGWDKVTAKPHLLVPIDILQSLPVAESWEDIDSVVFRNKAVRAESNGEIVNEWKSYSIAEKKAIFRDSITFKPEALKRIIADYKIETLDAVRVR